MTLAKASIALVGVCALVGIEPGLAAADKARRGWTGFAGPHGMSDKSKLASKGSSSIASPIYIGLRVWQRLGELSAVEAELPLGVTDSRDQEATLFVTMPRLQARFYPSGIGRITPSVVLGGGVPLVTSTKQGSVKSGASIAGYVGGGAELRHKWFRIGLEARYFASPAGSARTSSTVAHEWELLFSFGLIPGARKAPPPPPPPPPKDRDGDGVIDKLDQCPTRPEDLDGFEDNDGCPELDNDADGVIDGLDDCGDEAETFNGFEDDDGCSDDLPGEVRLLEGAIGGLRFDEGSGVMDEEGQEELLRLISVLREFPSVKIELLGHTDDREAEEGALQALGLERAESVRQLMIEMGIGHGRVFTFSRGAKEPFDSNRRARGRKVNRRVELRLLRGHPDKERSYQEEEAPAPAAAPDPTPAPAPAPAAAPDPKN